MIVSLIRNSISVLSQSAFVNTTHFAVTVFVRFPDLADCRFITQCIQSK